MVLLLLACVAPVSDAELLSNAALLVEDDARASLDICLEIESIEVKSRCVEQSAPALSISDPTFGISACETLEEPSECLFRVAEATGDINLCQRAGEFEFNCKMHLFSRTLHSWISTGSSPPEVAAIGREHIEKANLSPEDPRPWSAVWRWVLGAQRPLNRGSCDGIVSPMKREACQMTAVAVLNDRLNHHRDLGTNLCDGALPSAIQYISDPELDRTLSYRRSVDLCDESATLAPPIGGLPGEGR